MPGGRKSKVVVVNDKMQRNYRYECVAPVGKQFDERFKPELTPKEMLELGVFGGKYMTDCAKEFPVSWFKNAKLSPEKANHKLNFFKVSASQSLAEWQRKGWIHSADPRGWFQWYCRYYQGRRMPGYDDVQIKRWVAFKRHATQVRKYCAPFDMECRKRQRQALLHWAYDSRNM